MRGLHWFRNDLRLRDNTSLNALIAQVDEWLPVFVIDRGLLQGPRAGAPRTRFLLDCLARLGRDLERRGIPMLVLEGRAEDVLPRLMHKVGAQILSFNEDTTPYARRRDDDVVRAVERAGGRVLSRSDRVVFDSSEIRTRGGTAYSVYSPYRRAWWKRWREEPRVPSGPGRLAPPIPRFKAGRIPDARRFGLVDIECDLPTGGETAARRRLSKFLESAAGRYHLDRDRPAVDGTARLSPYLRFGAISVRECFAQALGVVASRPRLRAGVGKWLDELVWREFYSAILAEHPRVLTESYRSEYRSLAWSEDPAGFDAWCEGRTGYPFVDAGMRQLRKTGWMHNRVRMVVASFLTKDLLIDWRKGERYFFERLVDGDPASNNGGWQWAASTGTDPQPYFRIFNPVLQGKRWDPDGRYVRRWIPELRGVPDAIVHSPWLGDLPYDYPAPIVDHAVRHGMSFDLFQEAREAS